MRKMEEESFIGKAIPDKELEAVKEIPEALSKPEGIFARPLETRKEDKAH